ncbi:hypothetical protein STU22816_12150 [Edwardsiella ictaluri]|nr:hypothetical protein STU22726_12160 [Edwardsiella ictaluri]BEI12362.1 hypothetical protein STU22816_12150 [Edwardsiella ictaluri]
MTSAFPHHKEMKDFWHQVLPTPWDHKQRESIKLPGQRGKGLRHQKRQKTEPRQCCGYVAACIMTQFLMSLTCH